MVSINSSDRSVSLGLMQRGQSLEKAYWRCKRHVTYRVRSSHQSCVERSGQAWNLPVSQQHWVSFCGPVAIAAVVKC